MNYFLPSKSFSFRNMPNPNIDGTQRPTKTAVKSWAFRNHITIEKTIEKKAAASITVSNWVNFMVVWFSVTKIGLYS